ncbi:unnamed protein product [Vitrella brassicaformis CCMP3155]|uniref:Rieske domain-containing protein n=1 Tax=Vitrella brassicaformis (strain CCMP3155) TaxID=1169540 RepID=A0A0G4EGC5_VITBC|nr:unnamed protein product [Vitrella brassicaformis CCMP3155]|mmetsp:Transcript_6141/g.14778  ORF Transcript_6141/g.14778 Transcript_6141/m.14778 type:complete len:91 (+) Transcript_6141:44-316(+)|eukprot:CEL95563.1 unnamed protein product [Vitrella brassicaformis CCMP3155]
MRARGSSSREGIKGDAYYLVTNDEDEREGLGHQRGVHAPRVRAVVPWNAAQNKFTCPCHGSQYDTNGKVARGPAPLSLALLTWNPTIREG